MDSFQNKRKRFYLQLDHFWHDLFGEEYSLFDIKKDTMETINRVHQATNRIGHILYKTAPLLRQLDDDTFLQLGFPVESLPFIRQQTIPFESVIARLDLVVDDQKIKLLEINSDTPTFIKECFYVNGAVCKAFGLLDPNEGMELQLQKAIQLAIKEACFSIGKRKRPHIVFTSHNDHEEDFLTSLYLQGLFGSPSKYTSLNDLCLVSDPVLEDERVVVERGLYDEQGIKIDVLYRQTYPIEHLVLDEDPVTKEKVGQKLMELVEGHELAILNPPSAFLLQSKAVMAVIWGLYEERHSFFTEEEHEWIGTYFLPTYLDDDAFLLQGISYVKKPAFGREGNTIEIHKGDGMIVEEDSHKTYSDSLPVYQEFIPLPKMTVQTEKGEKDVHYMYGCFYVNGEASAIGIRAGNQITDNESYFLPVGLMKEEEQ